MRPGLLVWAGRFWGGILIIRGFRLRKEAWEREKPGVYSARQGSGAKMTHVKASCGLSVQDAQSAR